MIDWQLILGISGFVGVCSFLLWATYEEDKSLPPPAMGCVAKGPMEHWEAGEGRVRVP